MANRIESIIIQHFEKIKDSEDPISFIKNIIPSVTITSEMITDKKYVLSINTIHMGQLNIFT